MNQGSSYAPTKTIAQRIANIKNELRKSCEDNGRNPSEILMVAVSKGLPFQAIIDAYNAGLRHFGESYAQELSFKIAESNKLNMRDIVWHFIGAIQKNKIKLIAEADVIQSLDSLKHAALLNDNVKNIREVFLQVNLSKAPQRKGFLVHELDEAVAAFTQFKRLHLKGLMTIAPLEAEKTPDYWFSCMQSLREKLEVKHQVSLSLSMGMSNDFPLAIASGADVVRIGSSIFGPRMAR